MTDAPTIFVSSSMSELPAERKAVAKAVESLQFEAFLYERDAHAAMVSAREQWERELAEASICLVVLYRKLGEYTVSEIEFARKARKPILVYRKRDPDGVLESEHGEFIQELEHVDTPLSVRYFEQAGDLESVVAHDIKRLLVDLLDRLARFETGNVAGPRRQGEQSAAGIRVREQARPGVVSRHPASVRRITPFKGTFVNRNEELKGAMESLTVGEQLIGVTGPPGIGKNSMSRKLVEQIELDAEDRFPDGVGVSPIHGGTTELEDMLQAIWQLFHEVEHGADSVTVVDPHRRQEDLEKLRALVVVEDIKLDEVDIENLSDVMRDSTLLVTTNEDWFGEEVNLKGLGELQDALTVFGARYRSPIPPEASEPLARLFFRRLGGSPYLIEALARRARKEVGKGGADADALREWATRIEQDDHATLIGSLVPESARAAFEAVAAVGTAVPLEVLDKLTRGEEAVVAGIESETLEVASSDG